MLAALVLLGAAASADERPLPRPAAERALAFRGVGRVAVAGRGFCTGTLIAPDLVLTAAHCLYDARSLRPLPLSALRFVAANGAGVAERRVVRAAAAPAFRFDGRPNPRAVAADLALLELARPVEAEIASAHRVGERRGGDEPLLIVAYDRARFGVPGLHAGCPVRGRFLRVLALGCGMAMGGSGAPLFAGEGEDLRIVGVISASGRDPAGAAFTLAVEIAPTIAMLRAALAEVPREPIEPDPDPLK